MNSPSTRTALLRIGIVWTLAFAACHVYWAVGGRVGGPADSAPIRSRPVFLAYDISSAIVLAGAVLVAVGLSSAPTPRLVRLTTLGALVALARGGIGLVQNTVSVATGDGFTIGMLYDAWFAIAGVMFLVIARGFRNQATGSTASRSPASKSPVAPARTPRRPSTTM